MSSQITNIGKLAVCCHGKIGKITHIEVNDDTGELTYFGFNILSGLAWESKDPRFLSKEVASVIHKTS